MMIDVHLTDGRTVVRFAGRKSLVTLIRRDVDTIEEDRAMRVWLGRGQGEGFAPARLQYVRKAQIAWIEQVEPRQRDAWLAEHAPDVLEHIRAKEAEHKPEPRDPMIGATVEA